MLSPINHPIFQIHRGDGTTFMLTMNQPMDLDDAERHMAMLVEMQIEDGHTVTEAVVFDGLKIVLN